MDNLDHTESIVDRVARNNEDAWLAAGRLALGIIFVSSGLRKLLSLGAFAASLASRGVPQSSVLAVIGACVEFGGGLMVLSGFKTRYAALLMIVFVIVATAISHRYWEYVDAVARRNQQSNFFKNLAIIGGFLVMFVTGGGGYSIDAWLHPRRSTKA